MILKMRCPVWEDGRQPWRIVDHIERVVFFEGKCSVEDIEKNVGDGAGASTVYLHSSETSAKIPKDEKQKVTIIEAQITGNRYEKFVLSTEAYLCNDEGQTIERLLP